MSQGRETPKQSTDLESDQTEHEKQHAVKLISAPGCGLGGTKDSGGVGGHRDPPPPDLESTIRGAGRAPGGLSSELDPLACLLLSAKVLFLKTWTSPGPVFICGSRARVPAEQVLKEKWETGAPRVCDHYLLPSPSEATPLGQPLGSVD